MIHMGSDHRCVMATFTITTLGKHIHYKNTRRKHDMIEYEERDQSKKIEVGKLELEKRYQEIIEKIKEKTATMNNAAAQAENDEMKAQVQKEKAAAA